VPNFSKLFQEEVRRLARKEVKDAVDGLRKDTADYRHAIADLKRRIGALEQANKRLARQTVQPVPEPAAEETDAADRLRISSDTVLRLRQKLGLSQADFAKLLGVSGQSVYQWERRKGRLNLRGATRKAFLDVRDIGVREARKRLETPAA
jgi:DNA-binding transcriptional regulator YiaG